MIRIHKPTSPPAVLATKGKQQTQADHTTFAADRPGFRSGAKTFAFDQKIYGDATVKAALLAAQHDKCAFCEWKITPGEYGDVEHFRPKGGVQQARGAPLEYPGYYWLAYDWDNLLLACSKCNSRHKGKLFPLLNPKQRCRNHRATLSREQPLFINPATADPSAFIEFVGETVIARAGHPRGQATIDALGLDRTELVEHRLTKLRLLQQLQQALVRFQAISRPTKAQLKVIIDIQAVLTEHQQDDAEYSAMVRAFLR